MKSFSNFFLLFSLLGAISQIQAQKMSLESRLSDAEAVFEGKVLNSISFWDEAHARIYTKHQVQPTKIFKGFTGSGLIEIISQGGEVDETFQIICHETELPEGTEGIFFLQNLRSTEP